MKAIRTTTFYQKTAIGHYHAFRQEHHEYEHDELPQDHWQTEYMHVSWEWNDTLGPLTDQGGFYDVGDMSLDEIRRTGHE